LFVYLFAYFIFIYIIFPAEILLEPEVDLKVVGVVELPGTIVIDLEMTDTPLLAQLITAMTSTTTMMSTMTSTTSSTSATTATSTTAAVTSTTATTVTAMPSTATTETNLTKPFFSLLLQPKKKTPAKKTPAKGTKKAATAASTPAPAPEAEKPAAAEAESPSPKKKTLDNIKTVEKGPKFVHEGGKDKCDDYLCCVCHPEGCLCV
jgi:hypothetical protein